MYDTEQQQNGQWQVIDIKLGHARNFVTPVCIVDNADAAEQIAEILRGSGIPNWVDWCKKNMMNYIDDGKRGF